ncbi:hypothetical protein GCM10011583_53110 [Streptomyces camponoticapitis]|uniref:Uncharacterized protein n=1 Tax=Streptomyces camponoticapitis TaxID=1616125 RepID=A0ABQ2EMF4_9ACTN|nr:hypothetical protein [Streptomyces camponoticapitis]GGK14524.1 hypothetical protein GCM10011583_53110 [Streptomyces camponoticapitis]
MSTAIVSRPTERAALSSPARPLPPVSRVADLLIVARATGDRYGARHFSSMLDRLLGLGSEAS